MLETKGGKALDESEWRFLTDHSGHSVKTLKGYTLVVTLNYPYKRLPTNFKNKT